MAALNMDNREKQKYKSQHTYMNAYYIERYAVECNFYVVREERKDQSED